MTEDFITMQSNDNLIDSESEKVVPKEPVIYDDETQSVMTGSEFITKTGPSSQWIAPAWNPSSTIDDDYENDPRMLYNKCSLSCCTPQYPTPFQGTADQDICKNIEDKKYFASNYTCENNRGSGCLCMTQKQIDGLQNGFTE